MNRIYKVVWSKARNCYVVASELAKRHTKGCGTRSLRSAAVTLGVTAALLGGFTNSAWAEIRQATGVHSGEDYIIATAEGDASSIVTKNSDGGIVVDSLTVVGGDTISSGGLSLNVTAGDVLVGDKMSVTGKSYLNGGISVGVGTDNVFKVDKTTGDTTVGRAPGTIDENDPGKTSNLTVTGAISGENITRVTDPGTPVTTEINRTVDTEANTTTTTMETTTIKTDTTTIEGVMSVTHEHKEVYTTDYVYAGEHPTVDLDPSDATSSILLHLNLA